MNLYRFLGPLLFRFPPESTHRVVSQGLRLVQGTPVERELAKWYTVSDSRLEVERFGHVFPNPVGIAAGFDKNGRIPSILGSLGFGHVEIGGVTANPQTGNPRPRLFRLREDHALINRMGFNNDGASEIARRLTRTRLPGVPLGVNIGKSKATPLDDAPTDYLTTFQKLREFGDFFVVNVSSPNTPGVRSLQDREPLHRILSALVDADASPLLVKLSPDLETGALEEVVDLAEDLSIDGLIATNTTTSRPESLRSPNRTQSGGLSGKPLEPRATDVIRSVATLTDLPIIGVGGVFTAEDAYRKIRAGASLVQLYTGLIYRGPTIARDINEGLLDLLDRDGHETLSNAIGIDVE